MYVYFSDLLNSLAYKKVISESDYSQMEKLEKEYREKLISLSLILMLPDSEIREIFGYEVGEYLINLKRDIPLLIALNRLDSRSLKNLLDILLKREDLEREISELKEKLSDLESSLENASTNSEKEKLLGEIEKVREELSEKSIRFENSWFDFRNLVENLVFSEGKGVFNLYNLRDYLGIFYVDINNEEEFEEYKKTFAEKLAKELLTLATISSQGTASPSGNKVIREGAQEIELESLPTEKPRSNSIDEKVLENYLVSRFLEFYNNWNTIRDTIKNKLLRKYSATIDKRHQEFARTYLGMIENQKISITDRDYRELSKISYLGFAEKVAVILYDLVRNRLKSLSGVVKAFPLFEDAVSELLEDFDFVARLRYAADKEMSSKASKVADYSEESPKVRVLKEGYKRLLSFSKFATISTFMTGAGAIRILLSKVDVDQMYEELRNKINYLLEWEVTQRRLFNRDIILGLLTYKYYVQRRRKLIDELDSSLRPLSDKVLMNYLESLEKLNLHDIIARSPWTYPWDISENYSEFRDAVEEKVEDPELRRKVVRYIKELEDLDKEYLDLLESFEKLGVKGSVIPNDKYEHLSTIIYDLTPEFSSLMFQLYLTSNSSKLKLKKEILSKLPPLDELRDLILKIAVITRGTPARVKELKRLIDEYFKAKDEDKDLARDKLRAHMISMKLDSYPELEDEFLNTEYPLMLAFSDGKVEWTDDELKHLRELIDDLANNDELYWADLYVKLIEKLWEYASKFIVYEDGTKRDTLKEELVSAWEKLLEVVPGVLDPIPAEFQIAKTHNITARNKLIKRLEVVWSFKFSGVKPSWMVLEVVPVLPPDLRPIVPLEGGKFASSDLNDLYRRIINRNLRLKRLYELDAPKMIINNEKRMLQESVDALIDNSKKAKPVVSQGSTKRLLKSLSDNLRGKQGRFRHNLLGKRVDYSGRAVIVVNPKLKMHQCGVPKEMALELFKPFLIRKLQERMSDMTIKRAKRMIEQGRPEVWDLLEEVIKNHPVLLNRAPTLHRLSIQAFEPVLVDGKAIQIHPLVCTPYNADFDGDQMAIHVPLTPEAQTESRVLMLSIHNMLIPANGQPANSPTQDMVIGAYYLTIELEPFSKEKVRKAFYSFDEAIRAFEEGVVDVHDWVAVSVPSSLLVRESIKDEPKKLRTGILYTTIGRIIFNEAIRKYVVKYDPKVEYFNFEFDKKALKWLVATLIYRYGMVKTAPVLDELKELGFYWATKQGLTMSIADLVVPEEKAQILKEAEEKINEYEKYYKIGLLSREKLDELKIEIWQETTDRVVEALKRYFIQKAKLNPVWMMANSGARGSMSQVKQLSGMRGLMVDPTGRIIPTPVKASFKEGLSVIEYFISTHGARKGLVDTALRTADSGYLTRRMVDVLQDIYVKEEDCGTTEGIVVRALKEINWDPEEAQKIKVSEALGRTLAEDITKGKKVLAKANTLVDWNTRKQLEEAGVKEVRVYSENEIIPFSQRIRGRVSLQDFVNPETGEVIVKSGELITVDKAEKIAKYYVEGKVRSVLKCKSFKGVCRKCYGEDLARGNALIDLGEAVGIIAAQSIGEPGTQLTLRTFHTGGVAMEDIIQGLPKVEYLFEVRRPKTVAPFLPEESVLKEVETTDKGYKLKFKGEIFGEDYEILIPFNQKLNFRISTITRGAKFKEKKIPAWIPLTRGLLPLREVMEKGISFLWDKLITNVIKDGKGKVIRDLLASTEIPVDIYVRKVKELWEKDRSEDKVIKKAQEELRKLIEDYVIEIVQKYIVDEIQKVYVGQGVSIHDKHIELIVRQMSRFARIIDPGDTELHPNKLIDYIALERLNEMLEKEGKRKVIAQRVLLGITKAALNTESFLSAASFQETTKVLTYAAIEGQVDPLNGLKENVIIGKLIPTGTGFWKYRDLKIKVRSK